MQLKITTADCLEVIGHVRQICEAHGVWVGRVTCLFSILTCFLKARSNKQELILTFLGGKVKMNGLSVTAQVVFP